MSFSGVKRLFFSESYGKSKATFYSGIHLLQCMVYIDTNMIRAGLVSHPSDWSFCGYKEIQEPRRKNKLIDYYERLQRLVGADSYDQLRSNYKRWVDEYIGEETKNRQDEWTDSIAVGSRSFVESVKELLGFRAKGRTVLENNEVYQLREESADYKVLFGAKKDDIGSENIYYWDVKSE